MKRLLVSAGTLVFIGAVVASATGAFFSDTETSTGNTFAAGDIDLRIDNTSYVTSTSTGLLVASPANTWAISNLTNQLFFSFEDVKPGDIGEDTISIHAGSNDAYACMAVDITATPENTLVDPEVDAGDAGPAAGNNGELQNYLEFAWWADDGDNVFEVGETLGWSGPAGTEFDGEWQRIVDSTGGFFPAPLEGGTTSYIAKAWCFGELNQTPVVAGDGTPIVRGTGFSCNGAGENNIAQTDGIVVDVSFQAVQTRNNGQFLCSSLSPFNGTSTPPVDGPFVGAALGDYDAPAGTECNVNVDSALPEAAGTSPTITAGIAQAVAGQTVCVDDGTYAENVDVNKDITLASLDGAATTIINGRVAILATGVTVTGFDIGGADVPAEGNNGVYVAGGSNGLNLSYNIIDGTGEAGTLPIGVHFAAGATTGATVNNNVIQDWANSGAYVNPTAGPITFTFNDFFTNNVGIGSDGMSSASILNNEFSGNIAEAIGMSDVGGAVTGNEIHTNNFIPAGAGNNVNAYETPSGFAFTLVDAIDNYFAGEVETDRTNNIVLVDTEPAEAAAYAQN